MKEITLKVLTDLYVCQGLSSIAIAAKFQVSKPTVLRAMRIFGIDRRPIGRGLANRRITPPSRSELNRMIHKEHLGYKVVASRYGVDSTAVLHWLRKHGIRPPTHRETSLKGIKLPSAKTLANLYWGECLSMYAIGDMYGLNDIFISRLMKENGILARPDGFQHGRRYKCDDGHVVRSIYEKRVDNWLFANNIAHEYEPVVPWKIPNRTGRCRADFKVNNTYIEIWGVHSSDTYRKKREEKVTLYKSLGIPLIELTINSFSARDNGLWMKRLEPLLSTSLPPLSRPQVRL